ncbi:MAG: tRNA glutamyl-Q(34) synthetase GluQRS [Pseudomonadota bacterium]
MSPSDAPQGPVERFAPSPTGLLHLGHAFSAITAARAARAHGGKFLLRLEDLDESRVRPGFVNAILEDLDWLGISPDGAVLRQSTRRTAYDAALRQLAEGGLLYLCRCTRRDIREAASAPQERTSPGALGEAQAGEQQGLDGPIYPGTCRPPADAPMPPCPVPPPTGAALRLDLDRALASVSGTLTYEETGPLHAGIHAVDPQRMIAEIGDVVLARRDGAAAYHLAVVVDDAAQGVTHVTRGTDLFAATALHRLLQALLALPVPVWHHHRLIRDAEGRRLAKRDDARALATLRAEGWSREDVLRAIELDAGAAGAGLP